MNEYYRYTNFFQTSFPGYMEGQVVYLAQLDKTALAIAHPQQLNSFPIIFGATKKGQILTDLGHKVEWLVEPSFFGFSPPIIHFIDWLSTCKNSRAITNLYTEQIRIPFKEITFNIKPKPESAWNGRT